MPDQATPKHDILVGSFDTAARMGLDEERVRRRRELLHFGVEDIRLLSTLGPSIREHLGELTEAFFSYLGLFPEAEGLLGDPVAVDRARRLKRQHLVAMVDGPYGLRYAEERVQLALVYSAAGVHHHAFLGAFHHLLTQITEHVLGQERDEAFRALEALHKVALFDIGLILDVLTYERQRLILQQEQAIRALSTPVLKLRSQLLLLPLIGLVDAERARQVTEQLLHAIPEHRAKIAVIDITGAASIDAVAATELVKVISKARMMGSEIIVTGVSAPMAVRLVELGVDIRTIRAVGDLQGGIEQAEEMLGPGRPRRGAAVHGPGATGSPAFEPAADTDRAPASADFARPATVRQVPRA